MTSPHLEQPDRPWMIRTYSGHSTAKASNELYRSNLAKGQTGLSIAFDLPTQTGYDPDHVLARGEVGKVGVPVVHLGHHLAELVAEQGPEFAREALAADRVLDLLNIGPDRFRGLVDRAAWVTRQVEAY